MKNTAIQTAIDTIIREMKVLEENADHCTGTTKEQTPYLQNLLDEIAKLRAERNDLQVKWDASVRNVYAVLKERDAWATRFKGLEADMRGMEHMLTEERAKNAAMAPQLALQTKAAAHLGKLYDEIERKDAVTKQQAEMLAGLRSASSMKDEQIAALRHSNQVKSDGLDQAVASLTRIEKLIKG